MLFFVSLTLFGVQISPASNWGEHNTQDINQPYGLLCSEGKTEQKNQITTGLTRSRPKKEEKSGNK
jgi:hypothetical protein